MREYDPAWPRFFEALRDHVLDVLGVSGREAFRSPASAPWHHLYVVAVGGEELRHHLAFRDHLRARTEEAEAYAAL